MQLVSRVVLLMLCAAGSQSQGHQEVAEDAGSQAILVAPTIVVDPQPVVVEKESQEAVPQREQRQMVMHDPVAHHQNGGLLPNLPILGTLVGNPLGQGGLLGGLLGGQGGGLLGGLPGQLGSTLGGLTGGLPGPLGSTLGGLTGGLGNLGGLTGGLGNLGGLGLGGTGGGLTCPLNQKLNCKCENLLLTPVKPLRQHQGLEILQHVERSNEDGSRELSALLSNGLLVYQKSGRDRNAQNQEVLVTEGFYALKLQEQRYLTIYYTINDLDYTVKADVTPGPPKTSLESRM